VRAGQQLLRQVQPQRQVVPRLEREGLLDEPEVVREQLCLREFLRLQSINQLNSFDARNEQLQLVITECVLIEDLKVRLVNLEVFNAAE
jgi:hypothetical protein